MLLEGLFLPLTTPFYPDGKLYLRKLEHNVERYSRTPAAGLVLLTQAGERDLLSESDALAAMRTAAETAAPEKVLLADCSRPSVASSLDLLQAAAELGYDAALLCHPATPHRHSPSGTAERALWFRTLADRSPLPLVLAEDVEEASWLPLDLVAELARADTVLGWVCSGNPADRISAVLQSTAAVSRDVTVTPVFAAVTGRMLRGEAAKAASSATYVPAASLTAGATALATEPPRLARRTRSRQVGFQVLGGRTAQLATALRAGARGALLPLAACAPQAAYEVLAAWKDDDQPLLDLKAARLVGASAIEEELGPAGIKAGCDRNGYFGGRPRLPLAPLPAAQVREVERLLKGMRN